MKYEVYNLQTNLEEFELCGYCFKREKDYEEKIKLIGQKEKQIRNEEGEWITLQEDRTGIHQHSYTAIYLGEVEPDSKIYHDTKLIFDILLLLSIFGDTYVCTGKYALYRPCFYDNDLAFTSDIRLINAIEKAISNIPSKEWVIDNKLFKPILLLHEANLNPFWEMKILMLSPAIDLISKSITINKKDIYTQQEIEEINQIKEKFLECIKDNREKFNTNIGDTLLNGIESKIRNSDSVTAVDQLSNWLKDTLDLVSDDELQIIKSHAIAFNKFRNSIVHYAGLPTGNISIKLKNKSFLIATKQISESDIMKIGIEYFQVLKEILQIYIAKKLGIFDAVGNKFCIEEIKNFFFLGIWREEDVFEEFINDNKE